MIKTEKDELLIGLIGDTHIPSRGPEIPRNIIDHFKEIWGRNYPPPRI